MPSTSSGAQLLVDGLLDHGVEVVFGLPGVHNLSLWSALRDSPIRVVGVRHEQAAVYAADGYARRTGALGVALVTTGPGAANTLGAMGEAWASRSPVILIATDVPAALKRPDVVGGSLHESPDQASMFASVTVATVVCADALDLAGAVRAAALAARPRGGPGAGAHARGPVLIQLPADLLTDRTTQRIFRAGDDVSDQEPLRLPVDATARLIRARKPLIVAGGGAVDASAAVGELATKLGAPILTTFAGAGVAAGHELLVGLPPHVPGAGALWDDADLVITVGTGLDGMTTQNWRMAQPPALIAVNVDGRLAARNYAVDALLEADATAGCLALDTAAGRIPRRPWVDLDALRSTSLAALRSEHPVELDLVDSVADALEDDVTLLLDMCIAGYWLAALLPASGPRRRQYPMGWGTLGYALPASIGAALAPSSGPAVCVCGDGGMLMSAGELATIAQERANLTVVIVDDGGYGMLRYDQHARGDAPFGVELQTPDFVALAGSFGLFAEAVDGVGPGFGATLRAHAGNGIPSVIVARARLAPPPTTSPRWYRTGPPAWSSG